MKVPIERHGGQEWRSLGDVFVADFSVTTNPLGPPSRALHQGHDAMERIQHYPDDQRDRAAEQVARFCGIHRSQVLLGNGASELIGTVIRSFSPSRWWPGPHTATYREFERSALLAGHSPTDEPAEADIGVVVQPNNPTGDLLSPDELKSILDVFSGTLLVDESFLQFRGPRWRESSALPLLQRYPGLFVINSWTKLFSCPGLRIGSIAGNSDHIRQLRSQQVPWSVNSVAQAFIESALRDDEFLQQTWQLVADWKSILVQHCRELGLNTRTGPEWLPWVLIEFPDSRQALEVVRQAREAGCPVRHCADYGMPRTIRVSVRPPDHQATLFSALGAGIQSPQPVGPWSSNL